MAAFNEGDVVIYRVGDGGGPLSSAAAAVFLDEYTAAGQFVQSIALPTAAAGPDAPLVAAGSATSEGLLTRSVDGQYLVLTGYAAAPGTAGLAASASTTIPRVVGRVDGAGTIDTTTTTTSFSANNIRSAVSVDGSAFWLAGANSGVVYQTLGAGGAGTALGTSPTNLRALEIADGQLYVDTSSGSSVRLGTVGSGLPTTSPQTITGLPGLPTSGGSPYQFFFADLTASVSGVDTLYIADDGAGIQKYSLVGGTWSLNDTLAASAVRGLTGTVDASGVHLFATSATNLYALTDSSGYNAADNGALASIAVAGTNTAFRGVALAPVVAAAPAVPTLSIADAQVIEGNSGTVSLVFTVTASAAAPAGGITFTAATADGTATAGQDYVATTVTGTIAAGETTTTVTVTVNGDTVSEPNETLTVTLSNPANATIADGQATGTILNDDGTIIPAGTFATTFAANAADSYTLVAGTTRTQTAAVGVTVSAPTGPVNVELDGTLNGASGARAVDVTAAVTSASLVVGAAGVVQSLNQDAVRVNTATGTVNLTNLGQILATNSAFTPSAGGTNPGTGFAVTYNAAKGAAGAGATDYTSGGTITNGSADDVTALIRADNGDAVRLGSHETLVNWGTINGNGPVNDASTNNSQNGANGNPNTSTAQTYDVSRGVRLNQSGETAVRIDNHGTITGAQHGVDMGQVNITNVLVTNEAGASIIGRNGSGVGSDSVQADPTSIQVVNSGTIRGEYAPMYDRAGYQTVDGDGDGVDIDGTATIANNAGAVIAGSGANGNLTGQGAGGYDSNGRANQSEGISIGGGSVTNAGLISGANAAIVVNNDSNVDGSRSGLAATTILNDAGGTIIGQSSFAIRFENKTGTAADNDIITNYGTITGNAAVPSGTVLLQNGTADTGTVGTLDGVTYTAADNAGSARFIRGDGSAIQMGEGVDTLSNYGAITGNVSGLAINLEGGDDTLTLHTGSSVTGIIDGGAGTDTLNLLLDDRAASGDIATGNNSGVTSGTLAGVVDFEALAVGSGSWTLAGAQTYAGGVAIANGASLLLTTGASLSGNVVDNGVFGANTADVISYAGAISGSGSLAVSGDGVLTLYQASSFTGGTTLSGNGGLALAAVGAAGSGGIAFGAGSSTLIIGGPAVSSGSLANAITGFAIGDAIDVNGIGTATAAYDATTGDLTLTGSSAFVLHLGTGYNAAQFQTTGDGYGGTVVELAPPSLTIADASVTEGDAGIANLVFTITASAPAPVDGITVHYATADGTATAGQDYASLSGTATIAAGQTSTTITVAVSGDTDFEADETLTVTLSNPIGATIATDHATGTILNDDSDVAPSTVRLLNESFDDFTAAGFAPTPGAGQLSSNIWRVVGLNDNANPAYGFTGAAGGDFGRGLIDTSSGTATVRDPSTAGVYSPATGHALVVQPTGAELDVNGAIEARLQNTSGGTATSFDVAFDWAFRNSAARADNLQLQYSTDGTNFTAVTATNFSTPGTADATLAADFTDQHETTTVNATVAADGYLYLRWVHLNSTGGGSRDEVGIDNVTVDAHLSSTPVLSVASASVTEGNSDTTDLAFTFTRTDGTGTASVDYATANGSAEAGRDYVAQSGTVTFAAGETTQTVLISVNGDTAHETDETLSLNLTNATGFELPVASATGTILNDDTGPVAIYDIQGIGHRSPFAGQTVTTSGVVTQIAATGFYLQDATGDGDRATSDAVFVFGNTSGVAVGNAVTLTATVQEYATSAANLPTTELTNVTGLTVTDAHAALPAAVVIATDGTGIAPPTTVIDDDGLTSYDPTTDGIDFYESLEGMLVTIKQPLVVANTDGSGDTYVVASGGAGATGLNGRDGMTISAGDNNPETIKVYQGAAGPVHSQGDVLNDVTGVVNYYGGNYEVDPSTPTTVATDRAPLPRETTTLAGDAGHLSYASFNVENLGPVATHVAGESDAAYAAKQAAVDARYAAHANEIVHALGNPDVIGLQEIQDADGENAGTDLTGTASAQKLIDAIVAAGGPHYVYVEVAPATANSTGGAPNGNIRNGFLFDPSRVDYVDGSAHLLPDAVYNGTRAPLVADFTFNGQLFSAIDVHSTSRGGSDPLYSANQPPVQAGDAARTAQAQGIANYVAGVLASDPSHQFVVNGDFNGYYYETALQLIAPASGGALENLTYKLTPEERYSYYFDGYYQQFDNIIVSSGLYAGSDFDIVHYNAGYTDGLSATDHDQAVATIGLARASGAATAIADNFATTAVAIERGTVLANDTGGAGTISVAAVNGDAAGVGQTVHLASGGALTLLADGTFAYDPDGAFGTLGAGATATDSFTYTLAGGSTTTATVAVTGVATPAADGNGHLDGTSGNDVVGGTQGNDYFDLSQGGNDTVNGGAGMDLFAFGATFNAGDHVNGGSGTNDQVGIQGDYTGANALVLTGGMLTNVELLAILPGFSYNVTATDSLLAAGEHLQVHAGLLAAGQNFTFDGSAETDGSFETYGGSGVDTITGGAQNDAFYFGPDKWGPSDVVHGGGGTNDQLGLYGNYTITLDARADVELVALLPGSGGDVNHYNVTVAADFAAAGENRSIYGRELDTTLTIDASASAANLALYGGHVADTLIGGSGNDTLYGNGGGDTLTGGAGSDTFLYLTADQSTGINFDTLTDFSYGTDRIQILGQTHDSFASTVGGTLATASFDADLQTAIGAQLHDGSAVFFTPTAGDFAGQTFLVVDANGVAGYQAGGDFVFHLPAPPPTPTLDIITA